MVAFWSPFGLPNLRLYTEYFSMCLKQYADVQCVFYRDAQDPYTLHRMQQADLVVIGLVHDMRILTPWFCYTTARFSNCRYLLVGYYPSQYAQMRELSYHFRIPSQELAVVPYNSKFFEALRMRRTSEFSGFPRTDYAYDEETSLKMDLERDVRVFLQALGM